MATDFQRIYQMHDKLYMGLPGLATDVLTLYAKFTFFTFNMSCCKISALIQLMRLLYNISVHKVNARVKLYSLREERLIKPAVFANMVSNMLYEKRYNMNRNTLSKISTYFIHM